MRAADKQRVVYLLGVMSDRHRALREMIRLAPHGEECASRKWFDVPGQAFQANGPCDCWKHDALELL